MRRNISFFLMMFLFLFSCEEDEIFEYKYANSPHIELLELRSAPSANKFFDTLIVDLKIADEEGDLGVNYTQSQYFPFHIREYIIDSNGDFVRFNDKNMVPPFYKMYKIDKGTYDTVFYADQIELPETYNCEDFYIPYGGEESPEELSYAEDTVYAFENYDHYNVTVDLVTDNEKVNQGIVEDNCGSWFRYTFREFGPDNPYSNRIIKVEYLNEYEASLRLRLYSSYPILIHNVKTKFRIKIKDRALNTSNVIETEFYSFEELRKGIN